MNNLYPLKGFQVPVNRWESVIFFTKWGRYPIANDNKKQDEAA